MKVTIIAVSISSLLSSAALASEEAPQPVAACDGVAIAAEPAASTQLTTDVAEFTPQELSALDDLEGKCLRDEEKTPTCD